MRIEVRPTENDSTRLYKNGDISVVITRSPGGGGYFGLRSYGDVPTFRVDFLTQKYFRQGADLGFN